MNGSNLQPHTKRYTLANYANFLHKKGRYYESLNYSDQIGSQTVKDTAMERLDGLLLP